MYNHLLVPVDSTDASVELVTSAVVFATAARAKVTFVYTRSPGGANRSDPSIGVREYPCRATGSVEEVLAKAEAAAHAWGVPCDSMHAEGDDFAVAIVAAASERGCDLILLPSHASCSGLESYPSYATFEVLSRSSLPVLVAAAGKLPPPGAAMAILRDEHRSLASVLHDWYDALAAPKTAAMAPRHGLMRSMLRSVERLVARHQPKEELLFSRLRARTSLVNPDIEELERQHQREEEFVADLSLEVSALELVGDDVQKTVANDSLKRSVAQYMRFMVDHVGREEAVILTAARRYLDETDWLQLDHDFAAMPADGVVDVQDATRLPLCSSFMDDASRRSTTRSHSFGG
jgi:nucleotide-binding universal stress UspA family protein/hemerythrin-like domain-containing protein